MSTKAPPAGAEDKASAPPAPEFNTWHEMYAEERRLLGLKPGDPASGICLSGGGVRSAVTAMGILSTLSRRGILRHMHYMSTVSGGGYAGAALTAWRHQNGATRPQSKPEPGNTDIPFVTPTPSELDAATGEERIRLEQNAAYRRHLRANVSYLMPDGLFGILRGIYIFLRALLPNLFVWVTALATLFYALLYFSAGSSLAPGKEPANRIVLDEASTRDFVALLVSLSGPEGIGTTVFTLALFTALASGALVLALMMAYSVMTFLGAMFYLIDWNVSAMATFRYMMRRFVESFSAKLLQISVLCLCVAAIPMIALNLDDIYNWLATPRKPGEAGDGGSSRGYLLGVIPTLIGIGSALFALAREKLGKVLGGKTVAFLIFGCVLFAIGVLILAFNLAYAVHAGTIPAPWAFWTCIVALILAWACSVNEQALGRFYRDRLIEGFMPDLDIAKATTLAEVGAPAKAANRLTFGEMAESAKDQNDQLTLPLHLVNCNVMSWWSKDTRSKRRRGDNFVMSAVGGGSDMTGWRRVDGICGGRLTLATAISASGAAANPSGGFAGSGPTTLFPVALSMALLNIRLGYWLRWKDRGWLLALLNPFGNRINPPLVHFIGQFLSRISPKSRPVPSFVELTDGGHFENLGLYELVRRRCKLIIICDAGAEPEASYASFTAAIRRIREDFGAEIRFDLNRNQYPHQSDRNVFTVSGPQDVVPREAKDQYPLGADYADKGYFLASVEYPVHVSSTADEMKQDGYRQRAESDSVETGLIIYLKTALIKEVDHTTKGYRGVNKLFPYDPTSNQFFTPEQFEAYRDIGEKIAKQMVDDLRLDEILNDPANDLDFEKWRKASFYRPIR